MIKQNKVSPNVKIHPDQKKQIHDLADQTNNTYSDFFRMILTLGIEKFKSMMVDQINKKNKKKLEE